jgi:hypothetical protein
MDGSVYGLKLTYAVIGFFGAICSLKFIQNLTPGQAVLSVFIGTNAAVFGTGFVCDQLSITTDNGQFLTCWIIGLTAINTVPLIVEAGKKLNIGALLKK